MPKRRRENAKADGLMRNGTVFCKEDALSAMRKNGIPEHVIHELMYQKTFTTDQLNEFADELN